MSIELKALMKFAQEDKKKKFDVSIRDMAYSAAPIPGVGILRGHESGHKQAGFFGGVPAVLGAEEKNGGKNKMLEVLVGRAYTGPVGMIDGALTYELGKTLGHKYDKKELALYKKYHGIKDKRKGK